MTVDPVVSLLVGALGAALLALFGAAIQSRREHTRWLRDEQLRIWSAAMAAIDRIYLSAESKKMPDDGDVAIVRGHTGPALILGPNELLEPWRDLLGAVLPGDGKKVDAKAYASAQLKMAFEVRLALGVQIGLATYRPWERTWASLALGSTALAISLFAVMVSS